MITFIVAQPHGYTVAPLRGPLLAPLMPPTRALTYDALFAAESLPAGTYVFTDIERLHPVELRLASAYFRHLRGLPGFRVLNDPARVKARYALLRALAEVGINDFDAYPAEGLPRPRRFPVFLRVAADHSGPLGDLIPDQAALDAQLRRLEDEGLPLAGVLVVEFCGEPRPHGFYEKISVFRIGPRVTLSAMLLGRHWSVKLASDYPETLPPGVLDDQCAAMEENRHAEALRPAFDLAGIDYGRADTGFCGGRLQVYEINTNPSFTAGDSYLSEVHRRARVLFRERLAAMLHGIDLPAADGETALDPGPLEPAGQARRVAARAFMAAERRARRGEKRRRPWPFGRPPL